MKSRRSPGFTLIEVCLATGVAAFCLLSLFGLLPLGIAQSQNAAAQTAAALLASEITTDLELTGREPGALSPRFSLAIPAAGFSQRRAQVFFVNEEGVGTEPGKRGSGSERYRVSVWFSAPERPGLRSATFARIRLTWPAAADPGIERAPGDPAGSMEVLTALDRN